MIGDILCETAHRPWPLPPGPWIMAQVWQDLLFAHWPLPPAVMRALVPPALEIDTFDGQAWLGVVPFRMTGVRPRLAPAVPWLSSFPELNVRTYVRQRDRGLDKRGIYFFSLDAGNPAAVEIARAIFQLPYYRAAMAVRAGSGWIYYRSERKDPRGPFADLRAHYRPAAPVDFAVAGTLVHWLTERYALYTVDRAGRPRIAEIHHLPWPLQPAEAYITLNSMAGAAAVRLPPAPPLVQFARRLEVVVWPPRAV